MRKKSIAKKGLTGLLVCSMVIGLLPGYDGTTKVEAAQQSTQDEQAVLKSLNFNLPSSNSYKTDEVAQGVQYIAEYDELAYTTLTLTNGATSMTYKDGVNPDKTSSYTAKTYSYSSSTTFDRDGDGCKDTQAIVHISRNGYQIYLDVVDIATQKVIMQNQDTGGWIRLNNYIKPWDYLGLLSITAGDYDGDGIEEVAVYTPNNEYSETSDLLEAKDYSKLEIRIYHIGEDTTVLPSPEKTVTIADQENCPNWTKAYEEGDKNKIREYWYLPYMSLESADVNKDGKDDLLTVANFQTKNVSQKEENTWKEVLDPNSCLASVLDVYEGKEGEGFDQTVNKKVLLSYKSDDTSQGSKNGDTPAPKSPTPYGILRNASVTVANVTGAGSGEIVVAGAVTKMDYSSTTTEDDIVTTTNEIYLHNDATDAGAYAARIGYVSYDTLKKDTSKSGSLNYTWTKMFTITNQWVYLTTDDVQPMIDVVGYAAKGSAYADTIVVGAERFRYSESEGGLESVGTNWRHINDDTTNRWYGEMAVGNVSGSSEGKETVYIVYNQKKKKKETYHNDIWSISDDEVNSDYVYGVKNTDNFQSITLDMCDINNDSILFQYTEGDGELFYSDVEVLSVLQAAPVYQELGEDYTSDAETSYSKSSGKGQGSAYESVVSAGVVAGFEKEFNFLGLQSVGGVEFEASVSGVFGSSAETAVSTTYTTTYNATGTEDVAVLYTTPYVRYLGQMYVPAYNMPTQEEYEKKKEFKEELEDNFAKYAKSEAAVEGTIYTDEYNDSATTAVNSDNYEEQLELYYEYEQWLENTENSIADLKQGGEYSWGQQIEGSWQDYFYNKPQSPIVTTVALSTYDEVAKANDTLSPIKECVFGSSYQSGDPGTYLHTNRELENLGATDILSGKSGAGDDGDTGFIYSTEISASGSAPSQSIAVDEENATSTTRGVATEATFKVKAGDVFAGITASYELNSTSTYTTTQGCEYSGTVPNLPEGVSGDYGYGWKLVSYNMTVNDKTVPVVGYITKMTNTPPPSTASDLAVAEETQDSITLSWENGNRPAHHYDVYRVDVVKKEKVYTLLESGIEPDASGKCTFTDNDNNKGLFNDTEYTYVVVSCNEDNTSRSVYSEEVTGCTLLPAMDFTATIEGLVEGKQYVPDTDLSMKVSVESDQDISWRVRSYNWEYNDGSGWQSAGVNDKTMNMVVGKEADGYKYRCQVNLVAGTSANAQEYQVYTKALSLSVKKYDTTLVLTGEKLGTPVEESAAYGPVEDKLQITAVVSCEDMLVTDGTVNFALYQDDEDEPVNTFKAQVSDQGIAKTELTFSEAGIYRIQADFVSKDMLENCSETKEYTYYAYSQDETPDFVMDLSDPASLDAAVGELVYTGEEITPNVVLTWQGTLLQEGKDYEVVYSHNTQAGVATATIKGLGNFEDMPEQTLTYTIKPADSVPNTPDEELNVGMDCNDFEALNALLPKGWSVLGDNEEFAIGKPKTVTIVYTGEDAENYTDNALTKEITVTRANHNHEAGDVLYTGKEDIAPTCLTVGVGHTECTVCGATLETGIKLLPDGTGHKWSGEYTVDYEATCSKKGRESIRCTKCDAIKTDSSREYGTLKAHTGGKATCEAKAVCDVCEMEYGELLEHTWNEGEITTLPTAVEKGVKTYTCTVCGSTTAEEVAATGQTEAPQGGNDGQTAGATDQQAGAGQTAGATDQSGGSAGKKENTAGEKTTANGKTFTDAKTNASYTVTTTASGTSLQYNKAVDTTVAEVTIPATVKLDGKTYKVTAIGDNAFKDVDTLTKITVGNNVETIGKNAFSGCTNLQTVTLGKSVTTINAKAFYQCSALTKIVIPAKVSRIGKSAYEGCTKLKKITMKTKKLKAKTVGAKAFKKTAVNAVVKVPKKSLAGYKKFLYKKGISKKAKITK